MTNVIRNIWDRLGVHWTDIASVKCPLCQGLFLSECSRAFFYQQVVCRTCKKPLNMTGEEIFERRLVKKVTPRVIRR